MVPGVSRRGCDLEEKTPKKITMNIIVLKYIMIVELNKWCILVTTSLIGHSIGVASEDLRQLTASLMSTSSVLYSLVTTINVSHQSQITKLTRRLAYKLLD